MSLKKLAIVLFVKDEARDLPSWLAWHAAMGCETFIVYDDHSHDGTWEVIERASRHLDIRAARSDLTVSPFTERQKRSYLDALARHGAEFEWMAFIDSDEFLSTENNESIPAFLESFPDAHAVALNWCNYGSNGHALHPTIPIIEAFVRHSNNTYPTNRHVKSIVRCSKFRGDFINVHYFDVDNEYYADSIGRPIGWWPMPGIAANAPDWFAAKIRHFQCRSMEHFIDRLKLRPDVLASTETWHDYDKNDVEDVDFRPMLGTFHQHYTAIGYQIDLATIRTLKDRIEPSRSRLHILAGPAFGSTVRKEAHANFLIRTAHDTYLSCGDSDYRVTHRPLDEIDGRETRPVILMVSSDDPEIGIVILPQEGAWLNHETRRGKLLAYRINQGETGGVTLVAPRTRTIMTAIPAIGAERTGEIEVDRRVAGDWECMTLVPLAMTPFASSSPPPLPSLPNRIGDVEHLLDWIQAVEPEAAAPAFNMLIQTLSRKDCEAIQGRHGIVLRI